MDWSKGYSSTYYMTIVDPATWKDLERIEITGGNIKRSNDGLRESAAVDCTSYPEGIERWIRLYFEANQNGATEHTAIFTGIATSPGTDMEGVRKSITLDCYSVLKPAADVDLLRGWYAPAGANGAAVIKQLLSVTAAPVVIPDESERLKNHIIAEDDETHLTMIEKILKAIDWRIRIHGDGTINVEPISREPVATFDPIEYDVVETQIKVEEDWFNAPNVYLAIEDDLTAIARDDSPNSPLSTVNRGREVWMREDGCELADNETIAQYANRMLKAAQQIYQSADYSRRYIPNIIPGDYIRMRYPAQGLDGVYQIDSQGIALTHGARTDEKILSEV